MNTFKNKAVVLGTEDLAGLAIVRNLGRNGVYVTTMDHQPSVYGISRFSKEAKIVPHFEKEEDALVQYLIDYGKEQEAKPVLFLSSPSYLKFFQRHFQLLKNHYLFPMDKPDLLSTLMDKKKVLDFADEYKIPTPKVLNLEEDAFLERCTDEIGYPCLIKPKNSLSFFEKYGKNLFKILSEEELIKKLEELRGEDVFVQSIIPGPESNSYSIGCYYGPDSHLMGFTTTEKIRQWPNNFGSTSYLKQKWIPQLVPLSYKFFDGLGYRGFVQAEFKRDEFTGIIYLVDITPSFVDCTELFSSLGFEIPLMYYLDSIGQDIPKKFINYDSNLHWKHKYKDLKAIFSYLNYNQMSIFQILTDNKIRHTSSTWAIDDPGPGMSLLSHIIRESFQKLLGKMKNK